MCEGEEDNTFHFSHFLVDCIQILFFCILLNFFFFLHFLLLLLSSNFVRISRKRCIFPSLCSHKREREIEIEIEIEIES